MCLALQCPLGVRPLGEERRKVLGAVAEVLRPQCIGLHGLSPEPHPLWRGFKKRVFKKEVTEPSGRLA